MNCVYVRENIDDFLDASVDSHVEGCSACRHLISSVRRDKDVLRSMTHVAVPVELKQRIREQLRLELRLRRAKPPAWKFFVPKLAPVAAAIMLIVVSANLVPSLATKDMLRSATLEPRNAMPTPPPEAVTEGAPADKVEDTAEVVEPATAFSATVVEGDATDTHAVAVAEATVRPLWVTTAMGGSALMLLWSAVVFLWYRRL